MVTVNAGEKKVTLYSSIKEMPMQRYKLMQNFLLQDMGIGSTMEDVDKRLSTALLFLQSGKQQELQDELHNLRYTFFSSINGLDYRTRTFACLVAKIDEEACSDVSDNGIEVICNILQNMTVGEMEQHWTDIKKKLMPNLQ